MIAGDSMRMEHLVLAIIILVIALAVTIGFVSKTVPDFSSFLDSISKAAGIKG